MAINVLNSVSINAVLILLKPLPPDSYSADSRVPVKHYDQNLRAKLDESEYFFLKLPELEVKHGEFDREFCFHNNFYLHESQCIYRLE